MSLGFEVGDAILQFGDKEEIVGSGAKVPQWFSRLTARLTPPFRFAAKRLRFGFSSDFARLLGCEPYVCGANQLEFCAEPLERSAGAASGGGEGVAGFDGVESDGVRV